MVEQEELPKEVSQKETQEVPQQGHDDALEEQKLDFTEDGFDYSDPKFLEERNAAEEKALKMIALKQGRNFSVKEAFDFGLKLTPTPPSKASDVADDVHTVPTTATPTVPTVPISPIPDDVGLEGPHGKREQKVDEVGEEGAVEQGNGDGKGKTKVNEEAKFVVYKRKGNQKKRKKKESTNVAPRKNPARVTHPSPSVCSPFFQRVSPTDKLNAEESMIAKYVLDKKNINNFKLLFRHQHFILPWDSALCLQPKTWVVTPVIAIWALYLNHLEKRKSDSSPSKFFFPCETTVCMTSNSRGFSKEAPQSVFEENMNNLLKNYYPWVNLDNIDLIFFPVCEHEYFYLLCFYMKEEGFDIIDNSDAGDLEKYQGTPDRIRLALAQYFENKKKDHPRAALLRELKVTRLEMKWRSNTNNFDCGIYTMRHMETYFGEGPDFDSDFGNKHDLKTLNLLRQRYCHKILTCELNQLRGEVIEDAKALQKSYDT